MSEIEEKRIKRCFEKISQFEPSPDVAARDLARARERLARQTSGQQTKEQITWRIIMKSRITKLTAAAVIIVAVILGLNITGGPDIASVTWAGMIEHIENARTIIWKTASTEDGRTTTTRYMVLEPYMMRVELPDGRVMITDHQQERTLALDTTGKIAVVAYARPEMFNYDDYFRNMSLPGVSVVEIGSREINGRQTIGFRIERPKGNNRTYGVMADNEPIVENELIFWTDTETQLPVLIEDTSVGSAGRTVHSITDEIVFGAELDEALFSLEPPSGYTLQHDTGMIERMKSALTMNEILKACMIYDNQHGQWPDSIQELALPDIDVDRYVYLKPSGQSEGRTIVLYDIYDAWEDGINVGFINYRVELMEDESEFKELLENR
ncbi:MAG: hypothetical protein ACYSWW_16110 [Planctomycetota bacterium]|jgi:outer membrane lipoprotein-sorting protein